MLQLYSPNGNTQHYSDARRLSLFWIFFLERLDDMLQYNDYSCAPLATRLDYVDEPQRMKLSVNFTVCNRDMPRDTLLAKPVGLGLGTFAE